jgi:citrate synthase
MISGSYRIGRPRQLNTGYTERDFIPLDKRKVVE